MTQLISQYEWAKRNGFSKQYANKLVKSGKIQLIDGKVDLDAANAVLLSTGNFGSRSKTASSDQEIRNLSVMLLKAQIKSKMESIKAMENKAKIMSGEYILVEDVKMAAFNKGRIVRDNMLNIPDRISSTLASISDEKVIYKILTEEIRRALDPLAADLAEDLKI